MWWGGKSDAELSKQARWLKRPRYKVALGVVQGSSVILALLRSLAWPNSSLQVLLTTET